MEGNNTPMGAFFAIIGLLLLIVSIITSIVSDVSLLGLIFS